MQRFKDHLIDLIDKPADFRTILLFIDLINRFYYLIGCIAQKRGVDLKRNTVIVIIFDNSIGKRFWFRNFLKAGKLKEHITLLLTTDDVV